MKRTATVLLALTAMLGLMLPAGVAAATATATATVANCNGKTLVSANYVRLNNPSQSPVGSIQLCRDGDYYFAMYINYGTMPADRWANAWLYRYFEGAYQSKTSCDSPGGNGHVIPGQTWCRTPYHYHEPAAGFPSITFRGNGRWYYPAGSEWVEGASGWTARCNKLGCPPP